MNNNYYDNMNYSRMNFDENGINSQYNPNFFNKKNNGMFSNNPSYNQSYIENILKLNIGKKGRFHITVPGSIEWQDKTFFGKIEEAGKDHIIVSNPDTSEWYLILLIYLDYITFDEIINYN